MYAGDKEIVMEIELLTIGKTSIGFVENGIGEYTKRLKHYIPTASGLFPMLKMRPVWIRPDRKKQKVKKS